MTMSEPLESARAAVELSDDEQMTASPHTQARYLRDALRALIQWCEQQEERHGR